MWYPGRRSSPATTVCQYETLKESGKFSQKHRRSSASSGDVQTNILAFFEMYPLAKLSIDAVEGSKRALPSSLPCTMHQQLPQRGLENWLHHANWLLHTVSQNMQFLTKVIWMEKANFFRADFISPIVNANGPSTFGAAFATGPSLCPFSLMGH